MKKKDSEARSALQRRPNGANVVPDMGDSGGLYAGQYNLVHSNPHMRLGHETT